MESEEGEWSKYTINTLKYTKTTIAIYFLELLPKNYAKWQQQVNFLQNIVYLKQ